MRLGPWCEGHQASKEETRRGPGRQRQVARGGQGECTAVDDLPYPDMASDAEAGNDPRVLFENKSCLIRTGGGLFLLSTRRLHPVATSTGVGRARACTESFAAETR